MAAFFLSFYHLSNLQYVDTDAIALLERETK
jgi:hypothetical protein